MDLLPDFRELLVEFDRSGVEAVIVGGYAVAFHGRPRSTKDLDLVVGGEQANLERVARALANFGAPASVVEAARTMSETDVVWLGQPPSRIDILRAIDGVSTADVLANAVQTVIDDVPIRVIALDDLIANKRAAGRAQDRLDVGQLERVRDARQRV